MAIKFEDDNSRYMNWLIQNPRGFVLTKKKGKSPNYLVLHRSLCPRISKLTSQMKKGGFTAGGYSKICSNSILSLGNWAKQNEDREIKRMCKICKPKNKSGGDITQSSLGLIEDTALALSLASSTEERNARLARAPKRPKRVHVNIKIFLRNQDVVAAVLTRANGRCEGCGEPAPFNKGKDGSPYLEVHHRRTLAKGGEDTVKNAVALCPNCHRENHYGLRLTHARTDVVKAWPLITP